MLGLSGSHSTGKTTLAEAFAKVSGIPFVKGTTRHTYERLGLDPRANYPLDQRIEVQHEILKDYDALWASSPERFISDRTPLDFMAYMLADVQREGVTKEQGEAIVGYMNECYRVANTRFPVILIVQPGIPFVDEPGRPYDNKAYQEHIGILVHGFAADERYRGSHFFVPREYTALERRIEACYYAVRRSTEKHVTWVQAMKESGTPVVLH